MSTLYALGAVLSAALFIYLLYAMFKPEDFS